MLGWNGSLDLDSVVALWHPRRDDEVEAEGPAIDALANGFERLLDFRRGVPRASPYANATSTTHLDNDSDAVGEAEDRNLETESIT